MYQATSIVMSVWIFHLFVVLNQLILKFVNEFVFYTIWKHLGKKLNECDEYEILKITFDVS
jgi:hypothetical protein